MGNAQSGELVSSISALRTHPVPEGGGEDAFWAHVFPSTPFTGTDLFSVLSPEAIREMREMQPRNLALAVRKVRVDVEAGGFVCVGRPACLLLRPSRFSTRASRPPRRLHSRECSTPCACSRGWCPSSLRRATRRAPSSSSAFSGKRVCAARVALGLSWGAPASRDPHGLLGSCAPSTGTRRCRASRWRPRLPPLHDVSPLLPAALRRSQQQLQLRARQRRQRPRRPPPPPPRPRSRRPSGIPSPTPTCSTRSGHASATRP